MIDQNERSISTRHRFVRGRFRWTSSTEAIKRNAEALVLKPAFFSILAFINSHSPECDTKNVDLCHLPGHRMALDSKRVSEGRNCVESLACEIVWASASV